MRQNRFTSVLFKVMSLPLLVALAACGALPSIPQIALNRATSTGNIPPVTGANASVTVQDQDTDGTSVVVADVVSPGPGWMVIHNQVNGNIGDPIGQTQLQSGDNKEVKVEIDPSKVTPVLYAMLHIDAGTVGVYEFPGPDVPVTVNNAMVSPAFHVNIMPLTSMTPMPSMGTTTPGMAMGTQAPGSMTPMVRVSDQVLNNNSIVVDDVISQGPGWIVIYTTNSAGQPDQPIGHAAVKDGDNLNVTVPVDPAKAQGTLFAQLHVDQGTVGTFEYPGPDQPLMLGVQMIAGTFKVLSGQPGSTAPTPVVLQPSITVKDQQIQNGTIVVPQVIANGNWWLVIHRQASDGTMGEFVGYAPVKNGINTDVQVKINMQLATPVLYAMLHYDNPPIGKLEFPGSDTPVLVNGQMLTPTFNVTGLTQDVTINIKKLSDTLSYLTDGSGMSLYISLKDTPNKSNCDASCQSTWKPVIVAGRVIAGAGVQQANLGVITLPDGRHQVTYLGAPLYTYASDVNPGDTTGQGINGQWFLVTP